MTKFQQELIDAASEIQVLEDKLSVWEAIYERYDPDELQTKAKNWDLLERLPPMTPIMHTIEGLWYVDSKFNAKPTLAEALQKYFESRGKSQ